MGITSIFVIAPFYIERQHKSFDLFNAKNVFVLYILMQFVLWPTWVILAGYQSWAGGTAITFLRARYEAALWGMGCVIAGLFAFYLGYYLSAPGRLGGLYRQASFRIHRPWLFNLIVGVLTIVGFLSFLLLLRGQGDVSYFLLYIDEFRSFELLGTGYLFYGMNLLYIAFLAVYITHVTEGGYGRLASLLFVLSLAVSLVGAFRHMAVETIISWLVVRHYARKRFTLTPKFIVATVLFLILNLLYVSFRGRQGNPLDIFQQAASLSDAVFEGLLGRFHGIESVARIIDVVDEIGFSGGKYLLQDLATFWIPRVIWPNKPLSSGIAVNVLFFGDAYSGYETGAAVPSLVGSLYWIGGLAGVLWGMLLIGVILRLAYKYMLAHKDLIGLGIYTQVFIFAFYVNETLELHLIRLLFRLILWAIVVFLSGRFVVVRHPTNPTAVQSVDH
jgi:hypothetical protein